MSNNLEKEIKKERAKIEKLKRLEELRTLKEKRKDMEFEKHHPQLTKLKKFLKKGGEKGFEKAKKEFREWVIKVRKEKKARLKKAMKNEVI